MATTFINYYSRIFTKAALSRITGINERQLWHYAAGVHKPRKQQLEKIQNGINALAEELAAIDLVWWMVKRKGELSPIEDENV